MKILLCVILLCVQIQVAGASGNADLCGSWLTDGGDSQIELFPCAQKLCGKIVWLKTPKYTASKDGPIGSSKVDRKNPNPALRKVPILGLMVMKDMVPTGDKRWGNGSCYNPENGKNYSCKMQLVSAKRLKLRGYTGFSLLGRNIGLTRQESHVLLPESAASPIAMLQ